MAKSKLRSFFEGVGSILVIDSGPVPTVEQTRAAVDAYHRALLRRCRPPAVPAAETKPDLLLELARRGEAEAQRLAEGDTRIPTSTSSVDGNPFAVVLRFYRMKQLLRSKPFSFKSAPGNL